MPLAASSTVAADDLRTATSAWTIWLGTPWPQATSVTGVK